MKNPLFDQMLDEEITRARNSLSTDRLDMSFGEIMSMYERDEIIIDPEFQRLFRWSDYQKTRFIESLLLGIPIPPIFVAEDKDGRWELVDGLQRLSTVFSFFGLLKSDKEKNNWVLEAGELVKSMIEYSCSDLPLKFQLNIKRAVCRIEVVKWNSEIDMRYELFNRLNTGGSPLTDQEIRNCIFRGISTEFNDFLKRVASNSKFVNLISPTERQKDELYLEELVLRFASLYKNEQNIKQDISIHMTEFMRDTIKANDFDYEREHLFMSIIDLLSPLGKEVFRGKSATFSTSLYEAITTGVAEYYNYYATEGNSELPKRIEILKNDQEFEKNMGSQSNNKVRIRNRLKIAKRIFEP
jgi:uncharacterized protein with ParB-like and HNH nuclease domain